LHHKAQPLLTAKGVKLLKKLAADEGTINTFSHHYVNGAGMRPQTPGDAPPLAGFNLNISGCTISQPSSSYHKIVSKPWNLSESSSISLRRSSSTFASYFLGFIILNSAIF
jgi:hypothetical protein